MSRGSVYHWLNATDALTYQCPGPKTGWTLEGQALRRHVEAHADLTQQERAQQFSVSRHGIWNALRKRGVTRKKMTGYRERSPLHRKRFRQRRERCARRGKTFVYRDESGFAPSVPRRYA